MFSLSHKDRVYDRNSHNDALAYVPTLTSTPPLFPSKPSPDNERQEGSSRHSDSGPSLGTGTAVPPPLPLRTTSPPLSPLLPPANVPRDGDWQQHPQSQRYKQQQYQISDQQWIDSQHATVPFPSPAHLSNVPRVATGLDHDQGMVHRRPALSHSDTSGSLGKESVDDQANSAFDLERGRQHRPTSSRMLGEDIEPVDVKTVQRILITRLVRFVFCIGSRSKHPEDDKDEKRPKVSTVRL